MVNAPPPNQEEKRLIILLPADLLEEVRQAAEEADLSVSQIVRRAIRNELKSIADEKLQRSRTAAMHEAFHKSGYSIPEDTRATLEALQRFLATSGGKLEPSKLAESINALAKKTKERK
jgi:metal-responsive CopG/Arc/MetJ family transcriptional regulator